MRRVLDEGRWIPLLPTTTDGSTAASSRVSSRQSKKRSKKGERPPSRQTAEDSEGESLLNDTGPSAATVVHMGDAGMSRPTTAADEDGRPSTVAETVKPKKKGKKGGKKKKK